MKNGINSAEAVLCPPLTAEEVAAVEQRLGPLPPDVKEIASTSDGFHGGWHLFGGGWGGIKKMWGEDPRDYEPYLGYQPAPIKEVHSRTRPDGSTYEQVVHVMTHGKDDSRRDWDTVYLGLPMDECDDYQHLLCPPDAWKKMQAAMGKTVKEGEYAYMYYAHWTAGGQISPSVKGYITTATMGLERNVAIGYTESRVEDVDE